MNDEIITDGENMDVSSNQVAYTNVYDEEIDLDDYEIVRPEFFFS